MSIIPNSTMRIAAVGCVSRPLLYSTLAVSPAHLNRSSSPATLPLASHKSLQNAPSIRHATTASPAAMPAAQASTPTLTWNDFLYLRKVRRRYNQVASVATSLSSTVVGITVLSQQNFEQLGNTLFGLDPWSAIGVCTTACAAAGWLAGPAIGGGLFKLRHRRSTDQMALKEREFFERIKKYRVDPSTSSVSNPVPDYYGEKITSVGAYRRWLKDQRAFNRKRQTYV